MIPAPPLHRLDGEARVVEALLSRLRSATECAIDALRCADSAALETALDARGALLVESGAAIAALSLTRSELAPSDPETVRASLRGTARIAGELRALESNLRVALSAVHEQARMELRALEKLDAQTSRYRSSGQPHGGGVDLTG
ncbi:MAG: hypothetical protein KY464_12790 [Gemmatimonadetes bacterium]|nr:hypothetical protein [Gemmatimonadota bacterium]